MSTDTGKLYADMTEQELRDERQNLQEQLVNTAGHGRRQRIKLRQGAIDIELMKFSK